MKFSTEDYTVLENAINNVIETVGENEVIHHRKTVSYLDKQFVSFIWSIFWKAQSLSKWNLRKTTDKYYDSHIETALKKILKKYENIS